MDPTPVAETGAGIIQGNAVSDAYFPAGGFLGALHVDPSCGATLIRPQVAMTAAHCWTDTSGWTSYGWGPTINQVTRMQADASWNHPMWVFPNGAADYDVKLLRLVAPVQVHLPVGLYTQSNQSLTDVVWLNYEHTTTSPTAIDYRLRFGSGRRSAGVDTSGSGQVDIDSDREDDEFFSGDSGSGGYTPYGAQVTLASKGRVDGEHSPLSHDTLIGPDFGNLHAAIAGQISSWGFEGSCTNGGDDDGDGHSDCADPDCVGHFSCWALGEDPADRFQSCRNAGGTVSHCQAMQQDFAEAISKACRDGIDQDANGLVDDGCADGGQLPFGEALSAPGSRSATQYDFGGEGVAYHDNNASNEAGSSYRPYEGVDTAGSTVNWVSAGEWLEYSFDASSTGNLDFGFDLASQYSGKFVSVDVDGVNLGRFEIANTGSQGTYVWNWLNGHSITAGEHVLRVTFEDGGWIGFRTVELRSSTVTPPPSGACALTDDLYKENGTWKRFQTVLKVDDSGNKRTTYLRFSSGCTSEMALEMVEAAGQRRTGHWKVYLGPHANWTEATLTDELQIGRTLVGELNGSFGAGGTASFNLSGLPTNGALTLILEHQSGNDPIFAAEEHGSQAAPRLLASGSGGGGGGGGGNSYFATTPVLPGSGGSVTIEAGEYDVGGLNVSYAEFDNDATHNQASGGFRQSEGVDTDAQRSVYWIAPNEWLEYTVEAPSSGSWDVRIEAATNASGRSAELFIDGASLGTRIIPNVGHLGVGQWITWSGRAFSAGTHRVRIEFNDWSIGFHSISFEDS